MKKNTQVCVRIEIETRQELERLAAIEERTLCEMARRAMKLGMRELNKIVRLRQRISK